MGMKDPRVDAYIAKAGDFARPILSRIREIVHETCPDAEEAIKWGMPFFLYKGLLCSMAAFKAHCTFGFLHESLRTELRGIPGAAEAMGTFGKITRVEELPPRAVVAACISKAVALNDAGSTPMSGRVRKPSKPPEVPPDLAAALKKNRKAAATFTAFSPSKKKDYVEWIVEAKGQDTRRKRVATAIEWLAEGKERNWKYAR
jgi:uncharacterized protein YdeI (YjbR/CyaY-like superfamily)